MNIPTIVLGGLGVWLVLSFMKKGSGCGCGNNKKFFDIATEKKANLMARCQNGDAQACAEIHKLYNSKANLGEPVLK